MEKINVAILGASGAVGREMLKILEEYDIPVAKLLPLASARSAGGYVKFHGEDVLIEEATDESFAGMDYVLGAVKNGMSKRFAPAIVKSGAVYIDNSLTHAEGCTRVSLRLIEDHERVVISVNDDGCGIAPEKLHFVFDRYRHGFGIADIDHGAGLGLTAALAIANLHGGTLLLESREEVGTTVRASFSRNPVPSQQLYAAQEEPERGMRALLTGLADCLPDRCFGEKYAE